MKVLIVDDEPTLRQMVRLTLDDIHEVHEAGDAGAALTAIGTHGPFDVVLLDQKMPGMSGVEALAEIRRLAPATRVVMLTAHASLDLASAALAAGASHFLAKPMTPALLRAAVAAARPHPAAAAGAPHQEHTITLNGFTIDATHTSRVGSNGSATHIFTVSHVVGGWTKHVEVHVARDAFRRSGRPDIAVGGRLASLIARRALSNELWQQGMLPERDQLDVRDVSDTEIAVALREDAA
jgi:CheY-like chemotaxis protein